MQETPICKSFTILTVVVLLSIQPQPALTLHASSNTQTCLSPACWPATKSATDRLYQPTARSLKPMKAPQCAIDLPDSARDHKSHRMKENPASHTPAMWLKSC